MKKFVLSLIVVCIAIGIGVYIYMSSVNNNNEYKDISFNNYQTKIKDNKSFFLYVYQTGCPACDELKPTLNKVIKNKKVMVYALELSKYGDEYKDYFIKNNIVSTPTLIHYKNGKEDYRLGEQLITEEKLNKFLNRK
ncbi:thioredoxin family protein [Bacillus sp. CLL-7-23]|uniref:Thioredoxin family protein n=1 Tax=Bacillus changyiensis TaxID=3004103 RepID=A0ABT4X495_9BACI|nr:thioredoxin family protein [Bacillus changyiensis]MDA7027084.1 thioredoxin family protein [Bacillus changyiensis]